MCPTKERNLTVSGTDEKNQLQRRFSLGTPSPDPWDLSHRCQSQPTTFAARVQLSPNPSLVLAPESTLRLLPSTALSFAPAACSVSARALLCNGGTKKDLIIAALSDMCHNGREKLVVNLERKGRLRCHGTTSTTRAVVAASLTTTSQ